ncbi:DUF4838 domain-containing protein [Paenibacillus sp. J5C_2022]|uniref:DUF4838 domain-containing protein n=1 Tax=Paenibacillus sp. J5C2022 TaxID=2977129 RepID=UPI0021CE8226|nr:DUF4838 domain-containing protein [Paenibacillus sp. J5C2022]MCU6710559.1 DUF4838 domain-containing protein [Paenibacillus sp. J5C2022]
MNKRLLFPFILLIAAFTFVSGASAGSTQHLSAHVLDELEAQVDTYESADRIAAAFAAELQYRLDIIRILLDQDNRQQALLYMEDLLTHIHDPAVQQQGLILPETADALETAAAPLLQLLEGEPVTMDIVRDGRPNAVIVVDETVYTTEPSNPGIIQGWTQVYGQGGIAVSALRSYSGQHSLHIDDNSGGTYGVVSKPVPVIPGQTYTASVMIYRESGGKAEVYLRYYDENMARVSQKMASDDHPLAVWSETAATEKAPANAAYAAIVLYSGTAQASLYLDDVSLTSADGEDVPVPHSGFEPVLSWESEAADAIVEYVQKSTGAILPVLTEQQFSDNPEAHAGQVVIRLATSDSIAGEDAELDSMLDGLERDGFVIHFHPDEITIAGPSRWGTNNGAFDFLERYVGVSWLMPGEYGEDVPEQSDIAVIAEDVREEPAFSFRIFSPLHGDPADEAAYGHVQNEWAQHNRMQGFYNAPVSFHHNLYALFPVEKFGQSNPEFYPGGIPPAPGVQIDWQPCFSAPGIADAAVDEIVAYFNAHPEAESYSLGVNDGSGYCEANPIQSYYSWVNEVVAGVLEVHPDKWFGLLAYRVMETPPTFQLHDRVVPFLTTDRMAWADPAAKAAGHQLTEQWLQRAAQVGFYDYIYGSPYLVPRLYPHLIADTYRYAQEQGVSAHYAELYPNWGEGPKAWLAAKLQWDPLQDVDVLLQEWYVRAVGEDAAPYLQDYYEHWEQFWTTEALSLPWFLPGATYQDFTSPAYLTGVDAADMAYSRQLLEQVVDKAETGQQQARADMLMKSFEYYEASVLSYPRPADIPADAAAAIALMENAADTVGQKLQLAGKRIELLDEFQANPALIHRFDARRYNQLVWSGWNVQEYWALVDYMREREPAGGPVRTRALELKQTHPSQQGRLYAAMLLSGADGASLTQNPSFEQGDAAAPPWELLPRSTSTRAVVRSQEEAYSGTGSMKVYGKGWGGPSQVIDVEPGMASLSFRYYMPSGSGAEVHMQWGYDLLDEQGNWLSYSTVRSPVATMEDTGGVWLEGRLRGEIPAQVKGSAVSKVRLIFLIDSTEPVELYIDDVAFYNESYAGTAGE